MSATEHETTNHPAFLLGVAQQALENIANLAVDLPDARRMATMARAELERTPASSRGAIQRGREHLPQVRDDIREPEHA